MAKNDMTMCYTRLYAGSDGETHFQDAEITLESKNYAPPAPPAGVAFLQSAIRVVAIGFPPGLSAGLHPAPKHQWVTVATGALEIGASDGETRILSPGSVVHMEDAGSKGHSTRAMGDEQTTILVTEVD